MIRPLLDKVIQKQNLTSSEAETAFGQIMKGEVSEILLSSFLTALKAKGEAIEEVLGAVIAMREASVKPSAPISFPFLDTCGTGGDGLGSFNVSTLSAFTLASLGVSIAKHGNRSVSSLSGSSDILESLGYNWKKDSAELVEDLKTKRFVFLFAPEWHPAMRFAGPVRKELGFRTIFNVLGPLANPFRPKFQVLGVYSRALVPLVAEVLVRLGVERAVVCHSEDGMDEFSIFAKTFYISVEGGKCQESTFDPKTLGLPSPDPSQVFTESKEASQSLFRRVLAGEPGSGTDLVALNAGAGLWVMGKTETIPKGFQMAKEALLSKKVSQFTRETLNLT